MRKDLILLFLLLSPTLFSQEKDIPDFELNITEAFKNDSILILNTLFTNKSKNEIIIHNPDFHSLKSSDGDFFWIPPIWDIIIIHESIDTCFSEGRFINVTKSPKNITKTIKKNESLFFEIPINMNKLNCLSDKDFKRHPFRKGQFQIQLIIELVSPRNRRIESNTVEFEIK